MADVFEAEQVFVEVTVGDVEDSCLCLFRMVDDFGIRTIDKPLLQTLF